MRKQKWKEPKVKCLRKLTLPTLGWRVGVLEGKVAVRLLPLVLTRGRVEIALLEDAVGVPGFGCVESVGDGVKLEEGQVVFFSAELGRSVSFMGGEVVVVDVEDVLGVLDRVPAWVEERLKKVEVR